MRSIFENIVFPDKHHTLTQRVAEVVFGLKSADFIIPKKGSGSREAGDYRSARISLLPLSRGERIEVRDLAHRTIFFGRDSRFQSGNRGMQSLGPKRYLYNPFSAQTRNLEPRAKKARWIRSLTLNPLPTSGEGRARRRLCKGF
jgi:hypothetical protein